MKDARKVHYSEVLVKISTLSQRVVCDVEITRKLRCETEAKNNHIA